MRIHTSVVSRGTGCWRMIGMTMVCLLFSVALTVSVVASPQISSPLPAEGVGWSIEIVDSSVKTLDTSIYVDSNDNPHISYFDKKNGDLRYASWTGSSWMIEIVDSMGIVGQYSSLALDSNDKPHVSYFDNTNSDLKYASWTGAKWSIVTVDSVGDVGMWTSLALDSNDYPHISYSEGPPTRALKYAKWTGSGWSIVTVDSYARNGISMALDSNDYPHISYGPALKYARWDGNTWNIEMVDAPGTLGLPSMDIDSNDSPHISYYNGTSGELGYARWTGNAWEIEIVDSPDSPGRYARFSSIALDSNDNPHIGYNEYLEYDLKYARWNGTGWEIEVVDSVGNVGRFCSLDLDSDDNPHISYHRWDTGQLKYATKAELAKPHVSLNIDPDTLNLKSKGRWITAYLTTENAKAEDIDPSSLLLNDVVRPEWWAIQNNTTLMVKFSRAAVQAILPVSDSVEIKVIGLWKDGEAFDVYDTISVIDPVLDKKFIVSFSHARVPLWWCEKHHDAATLVPGVQIPQKPMGGFRLQFQIRAETR